MRGEIAEIGYALAVHTLVVLNTHVEDERKSERKKKWKKELGEESGERKIIRKSERNKVRNKEANKEITHIDIIVMILFSSSTFYE